MLPPHPSYIILIHIISQRGAGSTLRGQEGGGRSRPTCTVLSRAWKDACRLTAVVSSWYGSDASSSVAMPHQLDPSWTRLALPPFALSRSLFRVSSVLCSPIRRPAGSIFSIPCPIGRDFATLPAVWTSRAASSVTQVHHTTCGPTGGSCTAYSGDCAV